MNNPFMQLLSSLFGGGNNQFSQMFGVNQFSPLASRRPQMSPFGSMGSGYNGSGGSFGTGLMGYYPRFA